MKLLSEILLEKLKVTKSKPGDCTLEEFLVWYYYNNTQPIEDLQFDEFCSNDFDPTTLEEYFDNNQRKLYSFLMDHLDDEIELHEIKEHDYLYYEFFVDGIRFIVETDGGKFWKK